jgi:hypothetical protein
MVERLGHLLAAGAFAVAAMFAVASPAHANLPLGACCLQGGACEDLMVTQCDGEGGTFIGEGTSCSMVQCTAPLAVPLLSIVGTVAVVGGLAGIGAFRLLSRRR